MKQLILKLSTPPKLPPSVTPQFIPSQHYADGDPLLYWKQPIKRVISNTWWRAYYAFTMRHNKRRPGMNL